MKNYNFPSEDELDLLPKDGGDQYNRLIFEDSLYLRSHAHQNINWYPWGQDAFDLAKITDRPLFLSIGYAACHWCHVMSDRTFDLDDIANLLNQHFVSVKIDRDLLPDIDQVYMAATQLLTQHGGWPNSVFCLPTGQPFYAGTYFPPDDHSRGPGFRSLLVNLSDAWKNNRSDIESQAQELDSVIKKMNHFEKDSFGSLQLRDAYQQMNQLLRQRFDSNDGGFGGAPKFPPFSTLRLLLNSHDPDDLEMAYITLDKMALSGLYDHVGGGFHRYSTDAHWHCPHFEKMLTDNAQMIELYSIAYDQRPSDLYKKVVAETIDHLLLDWVKDGCFIHSIDADSDGVEGLFYTVTYDELVELFSNHDFSVDLDVFCNYFQITRAGNMVDEATHEDTGYNIFHPSAAEIPFEWGPIRKSLCDFRLNKRSSPLKNKQISISGNALMAHALLVASKSFSNPIWESHMDRLIELLFKMIQDHKDSVYFDDVVYLLRVCSYNQRREAMYSDKVEYLWNLIMDQFYDPLQGGAWFSQEGHRTPISRIKDIYDQAVPSPNGVFIYTALMLFDETNRTQFYKMAIDSMVCFMATVMSSKEGCDSYWYAIQRYWQLFQQDHVDVQFIDCHYSDGVLNFTIDLVIDASCFLQVKDAFEFIDVDEYDWKQLTIDPYKSRRVEWSDDVIRCASGRVRIAGMCDISSCPDHVCIKLPVCSDTECFDPVVVRLPVVL